jgi:proline racemase
VHVGGDVHQVVLDGVGSVPGETIRDQRDYLRDHGDELRRVLLNEPRGGHPSLFADLVLPAKDPRAVAAFIIMEYMGYPLFSGSNTMATAIALVEEGRLPLGSGSHRIELESPGGLVSVHASVDAGKVTSVTYCPDDTAMVVEHDAAVDVDGYGRVVHDLVWAGCWYAIVAAERHGFALRWNEEREQGQLAFAIMEALAQKPNPSHPLLGDQGPVTLVLFAGAPCAIDEGQLSQRISPVVHPHSVSRCPSGTGTTAAVAQLVARGQMGEGEVLTTISSWDTRFEGRCYRSEPHLGVRVAVTGQGWVISRKDVILDSTDPLTPVQQLRPLLLDKLRTAEERIGRKSPMWTDDFVAPPALHAQRKTRAATNPVAPAPPRVRGVEEVRERPVDT